MKIFSKKLILKNNFRSILKVATGKFSSYIINLIIAVSFTKKFGSESHGEYVFFISLAHILVSLYIFGLSNSNFKKLTFSEKQIQINFLFQNFILGLIISLIIATFLSFLYFILTQFILNLTFDLTIVLLFFVIILKSIYVFFIRSFRAINKISLFAMGEIPSQILILTLAIFFIEKLNDKIILNLLLIGWGTGLLISISIIVYTFRNYFNKIEFDFKFLRNINHFKELFIVTSNTNLVILSENFIPIILKFFNDNIIISNYDLIKRVVSLPMFILPVTNSIIAPLSIKYFREKKNKKFEKITQQLSMFSFGFCLIFFFSSLILYDRFLIDFFEITRADNIILIIGLFCFGYCFHTFSGPNNLVLNLNEKHFSLLKNNLFCSFGFILILFLSFNFFNDFLFISAISSCLYFLTINYVNLRLIKKTFGIQLTILKV